MALTTAQKIRVFEVLEITYGPGDGTNANVNKATVHNNFGIEMDLTEMNKLRDELLVYLGTLAADVETEIESLLTEWDDVRLDCVELRDGSTGDTSGVTSNPASMRERIRTLMQVYVPVMDIAQSIKRKAGPRRSGTVVFGR
jgi:hypothetical protein